MIPEKICYRKALEAVNHIDGDRGVEGKPGKPIIS